MHFSVWTDERWLKKYGDSAGCSGESPPEAVPGMREEASIFRKRIGAALLCVDRPSPCPTRARDFFRKSGIMSAGELLALYGEYMVTLPVPEHASGRAA